MGPDLRLLSCDGGGELALDVRGRGRPDPDGHSKIKRTGRINDVEDGLSEMPHVIVNQARMLAYLLDYMQRSASKSEPFYGLHANDIQIDNSGWRNIR